MLYIQIEETFFINNKNEKKQRKLFFEIKRKTFFIFFYNNYTPKKVDEIISELLNHDPDELSERTRIYYELYIKKGKRILLEYAMYFLTLSANARNFVSNPKHYFDKIPYDLWMNIYEKVKTFKGTALAQCLPFLETVVTSKKIN